MDLNELAKALSEQPEALTIMLYGDSKSGKTRMAGTLAKVPYIRRIHWFDLERGIRTLVTMIKEGILTPEEAAKIIVYQIPDSPEVPRVFETISKALTSRLEGTICIPHGKWDCETCKKDPTKVQPFFLKALKDDEFVVIDTGSQLADSIMAYYCKGKPLDFKQGWDEYGPQTRVLSELFSIIQGCGKNFCVLTHTNLAENEKGEDKVVPAIGTKAMSLKSPKYFAHVIHMEIKTVEVVEGEARAKHGAGSSTLYKPGVITGSRAGWKIESEKECNFALLFKRLKEEQEVPKKA